MRVDGEATATGGGTAARLQGWSGWLAATVCCEEFNESGFDVGSQGTALRSRPYS